jgi:hypothetical protein
LACGSGATTAEPTATVASPAIAGDTVFNLVIPQFAPRGARLVSISALSEGEAADLRFENEDETAKFSLVEGPIMARVQLGPSAVEVAIGPERGMLLELPRQGGLTLAWAACGIGFQIFADSQGGQLTADEAVDVARSTLACR